MSIASETVTTVAILLIAVGVLGWGFYRARPFGKLGILAWLQSTVLMLPWLLVFGLFAAQIYVNLAGVLLLLVLSTGLYIYLGRQLRAAAQDPALFSPPTASSENTPTNPPAEATPTNPIPVEPIKTEVVPIPTDDLKVIQGLFGIDSFFCTETIPYQDGAIFKGNLRGEPAAVHSKLTANLKERLGDRYRLFLVENQEAKPVMIVLPQSSDPPRTSLFQKGFAAMLALATIATSLETSGLLMGFDFFTAPNRWQEILPFSLGILSILLVHEIGHWVLANRYQIRLSPPFAIPTWQIGSFGALTRFESLLPNRTVLFDIAFAGPAAGGLLSLGMLIIGLLLSHPGSFFHLPSDFFQGSMLVGTLARIALGSQLQQDTVDVHPLTLLGWLGLVVTALNLMPAGQLDGGRIVQAIYGRKVANRTTIGTLMVLGVASLVNPLALYWAIVIFFLQRNLERPSLNELTEPNDARAGLALLILFLMITTLLPLTPSLAGRLGIGS